MEHDGVLIDGACYDQGRETLDLPATLVLDDDSMLDDVFNVVFDRLGCCVIELRIHAEDERYRRAA
jgi:hypothetical protein